MHEVMMNDDAMMMRPLAGSNQVDLKESKKMEQEITGTGAQLKGTGVLMRKKGIFFSGEADVVKIRCKLGGVMKKQGNQGAKENDVVELYFVEHPSDTEGCTMRWNLLRATFNKLLVVGFNMVHSFCALSTLRRSGLRTASAAAKPCQGDSLEFYLITGSIYTDKRGTVVLATLFNKSEERHFRLFITNIYLQESRRSSCGTKDMSIHNPAPHFLFRIKDIMKLKDLQHSFAILM
ncbi:hypothetical protein Tco_0644862 [Tanacetum coccineum]